MALIVDNIDDQLYKLYNCIRSQDSGEVLLSVSEWAEKRRVMTGKVAAKTGPYRFSYMPYLKEIADRFSKNDSTREVAIMKGVQLGFTTGVFENTIGYSIEFDPGPTLFASADKQLIKDFKKVRIDNLLDNSGLRDRIIAETGNVNTRRQGDTATMLEYIGGFIRFVGPNNKNDLRTFSVKKALLDEIDGWKEDTGDGDPVALAVARTNNYSRVRKIGYISTLPVLSIRAK